MRLSLFLGSLPVWSFHASLRLSAPCYHTQQLATNPLSLASGILPSASHSAASGAAWSTFLTDLPRLITLAWSTWHAFPLFAVLSLPGDAQAPLQGGLVLNQSWGHCSGFGPCEEQPHAAKKLPVIREHIGLWKGCRSGYVMCKLLDLKSRP